MSALLGVLPLNHAVVVPGLGAHVLTPDDLDPWTERAAGTPVHSAVSAGRPSLAGHVDRVRLDRGRAYIYGDLDPGTPGGAEARWAVTSGVYDQLDARMMARPDPLRNVTDYERGVLRRHWGAWPTDHPGVIIYSLSVAPMGIVSGAAWLGA